MIPSLNGHRSPILLPAPQGDKSITEDNMPTQKFTVTFSIDGYEIDKAVIELDQHVIEQVDDEWRETFYPSIKTPEEIAALIANEMVIHKRQLTQIDGFADLRNDMAKVIRWPNFNWIAEAEVF
jgi:hypothetical protein